MVKNLKFASKGWNRHGVEFALTGSLLALIIPVAMTYIGI